MGQKVRFRTLFDSASYKSFITVQAVKSVGLRPVRKECLVVNTIGSKAKQYLTGHNSKRRKTTASTVEAFL